MILIIDNYDSFTYNLYQAISPFYTDVHVIRNNKMTIDDIKQLKPMGIILSPGPGRPENAGICIDLIRAIVTGNIDPTPLLGVCLGHQALTVALGGSVVQSDEIMHGKDDLIFHRNTNLYRSLPLPFKAARYHSLIADRHTLPSTLVIQAENKQHLIMGIRHIKLPLFGVQFHPESIMTPEGKFIFRNFVSICAKQASLQGALA